MSRRRALLETITSVSHTPPPSSDTVNVAIYLDNPGGIGRFTNTNDYLDYVDFYGDGKAYNFDFKVGQTYYCEIWYTWTEDMGWDYEFWIEIIAGDPNNPEEVNVTHTSLYDTSKWLEAKIVIPDNLFELNIYWM